MLLAVPSSCLAVCLDFFHGGGGDAGSVDMSYKNGKRGRALQDHDCLMAVWAFCLQSVGRPGAVDW